MADPTPAGGQEEKVSIEEQIAARVNEAQAEDLIALDVDDQGDFKAAPEPEEAAPVATPTAPAAPVAPEGPKMVAIVVDGQTIEVEESRVLESGKRYLQKDRAADARLQDAARIRREADEYAAARGYRPSQDAAPVQQPAPSQDAPQQFTSEALAPVIKNILYNEKAEDAGAKFREEFPEIAADPHLMDMAARLEDQRLRTAAALGESIGDPFRAYRAHGEAIRTWLGKYKPADPPSTDKIERKRTITAVPAVNAKAPQAQEEKAPSVQDIIAAERRARLGRPNTRSH